MNLYEYLIGGKKIGVRQSPEWEDLRTGDTVYYWTYADSSFITPENAIIILTIKDIKIIKSVVTITTAAITGDDSDSTFNFAGGRSSTGKMVDNNGLKLYCATTMEDLKKIVPEKFFKTARISDRTKK